MDSVQLHLLLAHVPVIGAPCAAVMLGWGIARRSRKATRLGCACAILVAAFTYPVFLTGEPAEQRVEEQPWFRDRLAHRHEGGAELALTATLISGLLAALALWGSRKNRPVSRGAASLTLAGFLLSTALLGWTARLGASLRADELRGGASATAPAPGAGAMGSAADRDRN
jgi:hypothetical protein